MVRLPIYCPKGLSLINLDAILSNSALPVLVRTNPKVLPSWLA